MQTPDLGAGAVVESRRAFLTCCSSLALAFAGCARLSPAARAGHALLNDPPLRAYAAVLDGLIGAVLPFEDAAFPLRPDDVRIRLLDLFDLDRDPRLVTIERTLVLFDDVDLFPHSSPLRAAERELLQALDSARDPEPMLRSNDAGDRRRFAAFASGRDVSGAAFHRLPVQAKREYLLLWEGSGFLLRRRFYASARALVLIAAYSTPALWPAIGYDGPLMSGSAANRGHARRL